MKRFAVRKGFFFLWALCLGVNADPLLDAANRALDGGNYRKAEFLYQQALKAGANEAIIDYNLAIVNYRMEKISEAIRYFKKVTELAPQFKDSYLNLGRIYYSLEAYVDSLNTFLTFLDRDPADEETLLLAGDVFKKLSLFKEAEEYYTKALDLRATNADPHLAMASLYLDLGDQEKTLALLDRAVRKVSEPRVLRELQAQVMKDAGRFRDAAAVLETLLTTTKKLTEDQRYNYKYQMADCYQQGGFANLAVLTLRELIAEFPEKTQAVEYAGYLYINANRWDDAFDFYAGLFDKNRAQAYLGVKKVFSHAYNQNDKALLKKVLEFYRANKIRDELYLMVEGRGGV